MIHPAIILLPFFAFVTIYIIVDSKGFAIWNYKRNKQIELEKVDDLHIELLKSGVNKDA